MKNETLPPELWERNLDGYTLSPEPRKPLTFHEFWTVISRALSSTGYVGGTGILTAITVRTAEAGLPIDAIAPYAVAALLWAVGTAVYLTEPNRSSE